MTVYPWIRYWYKQDNAPDIRNGFLHLWGRYEQAALSFAKFDGTPCIVLLGEPGIGKSTELGSTFDTHEGSQKLFVKLGHITDIGYLLRETFDSELFKQWREGDAVLTLFLDSLDEGNQNINGLVELLANELVKLPTDRLRLRITCRAAEWSSLSKFEGALRKIWKGDEFQIVRLAPLTPENVIEAAKIEGLDGEKFLKDVFEKGVAHLAAKPVTLRLLLNQFSANTELSSNQFELYERGMLAYCQEESESRPATRQDRLTPEQRMRIAGRIAILTIFSNRSSIWVGSDTGEQKEADILLSELAGYSEKGSDGVEFAVGESEIKETVHKGLFTSEGPNRIRFYHQTYAEFLVAWYLQYRDLPDDSIIHLIGDEYCYPQLDETAAWIASCRPAIFKHLIKNAPMVLLRSEVISADDHLRFELTKRILEIFESEEGRDDWTRSHYDRLKNQKLPDQLSPFINDKSKGWLVRRVAIDIAETCKVMELQNDLASVALDQTELHSTRVNAAYAVTRIGDNETKKRLLPLIYENNDENLELKGRGLAANWRENLSAKELFEVLEPPLAYFSGSYNLFLYELERSLLPDDLPFALEWLEKKVASGGRSIELERISDKILTMAWKQIDEPGILDSFARIVLSLSLQFGEIFSRPDAFLKEDYGAVIDEIKNGTEVRRKLWLATMSLAGEKQFYLLNRSKYIAIQIDDINWLVEKWNATNSQSLKDKLLSTLRLFIGPWESHPDALSAIANACREHPELEKEFRPLFRPIVLDSEEAVSQKEYYEKNFAWRKDQEKENTKKDLLITPSPLERTIDWLNKFEDGDIAAWWQINWSMLFLPTGISSTNEFEADLTMLPVWNEVDNDIRLRLVVAAKNYLVEGQPEDEKWIGTNNIHRPAFAGYRAIKLVKKLEPVAIENLMPETWAKWAAIIYQYPIYNGSGSDVHEEHLQLIGQAYRASPESIIRLFENEIDSNVEGNYLSLDKVTYCWDSRFRDIVKAKLKQKVLPNSKIRILLSKLFEVNDPYAVEYACSLVTDPLPDSETDQELLMIAAELLLTNGKLDCWSKIWGLLTNNVEFGKKLVEYGVFRFRESARNGFTEEALAELFIWLSQQYPHNEDPVHRGSYSPGARDEIVSWREALLGTLVRKGTSKATTEINRIREALPTLEYLKFVRFESLEKLHENSWEPANPTDLLKTLSLEWKRKQLSRLENEYKSFSETKDTLDVDARRPARFHSVESWLIKALTTSAWLTYVFWVGWDKMEKWTWSIPILGWLLSQFVESIKLRRVSLFPSPRDVYEREKARIYEKNGFRLSDGDVLTREIIKLKLELNRTDKGTSGFEVATRCN